MSAQVTEAHRELARRIMFEFTQAGTATASDVRMAAQIIADSEEKATAEWQDFVHLKGEAIDSLLLECDRLRAEVKRLTAACDKFSNAEITQGDWKSRAERAEAKLNESRYETVKAAQEGLRECIRAERAEAELAKAKAIIASIEEDGTEEHNAAVSLRRELATERDIVSRIWVQLGSPTYEQLKGRSIYDLIDEMRAELATERARLDWLESDAGMEFQWETTKVITRAAIDAAMKEGA